MTGKFETSSDNIKHIIEVNNTRREGHVMLRAAVASGHGSGWAQTYLTPDEADKLAEMLRASAQIFEIRSNKMIYQPQKKRQGASGFSPVGNAVQCIGHGENSL